MKYLRKIYEGQMIDTAVNVFFLTMISVVVWMNFSNINSTKKTKRQDQNDWFVSAHKAHHEKVNFTYKPNWETTKIHEARHEDMARHFCQHAEETANEPMKDIRDLNKHERQRLLGMIHELEHKNPSYAFSKNHRCRITMENEKLND